MYTLFTSEIPMAAIASPRPQSRTAFSSRLWREPLAREHGFEPLTVEGKLPPELAGTLFRNGPGTVGVGADRYQHPFEGDGAVTAVRIGGGKAAGASRVTGGPRLDEERAANRLLYGLSTSWPRRVRNLLRGTQKNTANTSVMIWQDRLFAMVESSRPTELEPQGLVRIGESDLGGVVRTAFSAHPHRIASRRAIYNFGVEQGRHTQLVAYELPDAGPARSLGAVPLGGPTMLHDFIATDRHLVFFVSPVRVDVPRMLLGVGAFDQLFRWRPELGTEVIAMPIDRPTEVVRFTTDAFFQWHFANAFERGDEIVVDYIRYPSFASFYDIGRMYRGDAGVDGDVLAQGRYHRATLSLTARTLRSEQVVERACEFPTLAPGAEGTPATATYLVLGDLAALGKLDPATGALVIHELPAGQRTTEPLFVARPGATRADDGHLIALQHDEASARAFLAVYDAAHLPDGPVARAWFDHQVPITFHGVFAPAR
jgi:all-trans-8'-apo-beta-carotenal 15,15'-oxygenase